jgi:hypothetical protein
MSSNEDQQVTEWMKSLGFNRVGSYLERNLYKNGDLYVIDQDQATFFYKAQQANTKRILDRAENGIAKHEHGYSDYCPYCVRRKIALESLAQIRNEELGSESKRGEEK